MTAERSPLDIAIDLASVIAQSGYRVMWVDEDETHSAVLDGLAPNAMSVSRIYGRKRARFLNGGVVKVVSTSTRGERRFDADAIFASVDSLVSHWETIAPTIATSRLPDAPIYMLPERA